MSVLVESAGVDWAAVAASIGGAIVGVAAIVSGYRIATRHSRTEEQEQLRAVVQSLLTAMNGGMAETFFFDLRFRYLGASARRQQELVNDWTDKLTSHNRDVSDAVAALRLFVDVKKVPKLAAALEQLGNADSAIMEATRPSTGGTQPPTEMRAAIKQMRAAQNNFVDALRPMLPATFPRRRRFARLFRKSADISLLSGKGD
jgi:hypothetical protein